MYKLSYSQHSKEPPAFQEVLQKTLQRISSGTAKATRSSHNTITKCMLQSQLLLNQDTSLSGERRTNVRKNCLKPFAKPSELSKRRLQYLGGGSEGKSKQKLDQNYCYGKNQKKNFKKKKKLPKKSWKQTTKQTLYLQHAETTRTTTTTVFRKVRRRKCDDGHWRKRTK